MLPFGNDEISRAARDDQEEHMVKNVCDPTTRVYLLADKVIGILDRTPPFADNLPRDLITVENVAYPQLNIKSHPTEAIRHETGYENDLARNPSSDLWTVIRGKLNRLRSVTDPLRTGGDASRPRDDRHAGLPVLLMMPWLLDPRCWNATDLTLMAQVATVITGRNQRFQPFALNTLAEKSVVGLVILCITEK